MYIVHSHVSTSTAERVLGAAFLALQGGTACFGSCFCATLGRHSLFWELLLSHFREAQRVSGAPETRCASLKWHKSSCQNRLCRPEVQEKQLPKHALPPQSVQKGAPETGCASLKWHKSSCQNRLCRPEVQEKQLPKHALPPQSVHPCRLSNRG